MTANLNPYPPPFDPDDVKNVSFTFTDSWNITYSTFAMVGPGEHVRWVEFVHPKPKKKRRWRRS